MAEGERSEPQPPAQAGGGGFSWPTALGLYFLTFNSGMAVYRSYNDKATVAFVVSSYVILVALFFCIKLFERAPPGSTTKGKLKVAVWGLTTVLTLLFSYKVAATMPVLVQVVVWLMAFATVSGGFFAFFVHSKEVCTNCYASVRTCVLLLVCRCCYCTYILGALFVPYSCTHPYRALISCVNNTARCLICCAN